MNQHFFINSKIPHNVFIYSTHAAQLTKVSLSGMLVMGTFLNIKASTDGKRDR